jgi:hypothetical protein
MSDQRSNRATLILADISGYTGFLSAVGTAHHEQLEMGQTPPAYPLMTTLLDAIVGSLTRRSCSPSWRVTRSSPMRMTMR